MESDMKLALSTASHMAKGHLWGDDTQINAVTTDTRALTPGALFVALRGEHFDGHTFIAEAVDKKAAGVLVERATSGLKIPQLVVGDALLALGRLAAAWRKDKAPCVIGITGSNGKTSVKEILAHILGQEHQVLATQGNLNNHIGLPLTLLQIRTQHRYAVVEMGANHPTEIAYLSDLAHPGVAVLTNAGPAHLKGFGSVEGVAQAKGEIFSGLASGGTAVINGDDTFSALWCKLAKKHTILRFGLSKVAEVGVYKDSIRSTTSHRGIESRFCIWSPQGERELRLPLPGRHNIMNALAATAAAMATGMTLATIAKGLATVPTIPGRLQLRAGLAGAQIIDDSYNANPASVKAALELLADLPGERWFVLGDMGELGPQAEALHQEVGIWARKAGVSRLFTLGPLSQKTALSFGPTAQSFEQFEALRDALQTDLEAGVYLLIKGSRAARMERVVQAVTEEK